MSAVPPPLDPLSTNTIHIDSEPCHRIMYALDHSESDDEALAIIRPILASEPIVNASTGTKYNLVEAMLIGGDSSDTLKLALWNTIKDSPIWQAGIDHYLEDLVTSSSINSPFLIFRDLYLRWKSQDTNSYKLALKLGQLSDHDEEHRQFIEHEKQVVEQEEPQWDVFNKRCYLNTT